MIKKLVIGILASVLFLAYPLQAFGLWYWVVGDDVLGDPYNGSRHGFLDCCCWAQ